MLFPKTRNFTPNFLSLPRDSNVTKPTNMLSAVSLRSAMNKNIIQGKRVVILPVVVCHQVLRLWGILKKEVGE